MKIVLLNPNTSADITDRMVGHARMVAGKRAEIQGVTARFGPRVIGSRAENAIAAHAVLDAAARSRSGCHAMIVGSSMDTALAALRDLVAVPVIGMAQAAILAGLTLGSRIGCLTLGARLLPVYEEMTRSYGFSGRTVVWRAIELPAAYSGPALPQVAAAVAAECGAMAAQDRVDAVVLCGAVLTGYAAGIADRAPVPVLDCVEAATNLAVMRAETAAPARVPPGAGSAASGRETLGLSPELADLLAGRP